MCCSAAAAVFGSAALMALGVALAVLGELRSCAAEPALKTWMVAAGSALAAFSLVGCLYFLCVTLGCIRSYSARDCVGSTLAALTCACLCGAALLFGVLAWLGLWIAGMYFVLAAIGEMRVNREDIVGQHSEEACDLAAVILSGVTIIFVFVAFVAATVAVVRSFCRAEDGVGDEEVQSRLEKRRHRFRRKRKFKEEHIYDVVASNP